MLIAIPVVIIFIALFIYHEQPTTYTLLDKNLKIMSRCAVFIAYLGPMGNFLIYTLTLSSFREFLRSRIEKIRASLRCCASDEN
jgi:hypothetical protein